MPDTTDEGLLPPASWITLDERPIPEWFLDAKFGIFVHWGVYSVPAWRSLNSELFGGYAEWYYASVYGEYRNHDIDYHKTHYGDHFTYRDFAPQFDASHFDPKGWADLFKSAGARYVVLTAKHHDGYCLWPTNNQYKVAWNAGDIGPKRDLLGDLGEAVRAAGMRMGIYYSMPEWETHVSHRVNGGFFIPDRDASAFGLDPEVYRREVLQAQWLELNQRYQPSLIYTDGGEWDLTEDYVNTRGLLNWLYHVAPNRREVVVNDRMHVGMPGCHGDYFSTEYADIDAYASHPWEESRGIGHSYGYNQAERPDDYASVRELVELLVRTVARGGNLLLNVGPRADGTIITEQRARLEGVGAWLSRFGSTIYETCPDSTPVTAGHFATRKGDIGHIIGLPDSAGEVWLPPETTRVWDPVSGATLKVTRAPDGFLTTLPTSVDGLPTAVAFR